MVRAQQATEGPTEPHKVVIQDIQLASQEIIIFLSMGIGGGEEEGEDRQRSTSSSKRGRIAEVSAKLLLGALTSSLINAHCGRNNTCGALGRVGEVFFEGRGQQYKALIEAEKLNICNSDLYSCQEEGAGCQRCVGSVICGT